MKTQLSNIESVEFLGKCEEYVYDIGMVDNPHCFFANDILVHNSCFITYQNRIALCNLSNKDDIIKMCCDYDLEIKDVIEKNLNHITTKMNSKNYFKFETEELYDKFLITSKKKYVCRTIYDKNSKRLLKDQYNIKGMEFKKSNLSKPIKGYLKNITFKIMDGMTEEETLKEFKEIWSKIPELPIDDIAYAQGIDGIMKYGINSSIVINNAKEAVVSFPKACPYHVIGALSLNSLIDWDKDLSDMTKIVDGDKGKIVFVTPSNIFGVEAIMFTGRWNPKLYQYFKLDIEKIFLRLILQPLQPVLDAMNFKIDLDGILGFKFVDSNNLSRQLLLF